MIWIIVYLFFSHVKKHWGKQLINLILTMKVILTYLFSCKFVNTWTYMTICSSLIRKWFYILLRLPHVILYFKERALSKNVKQHNQKLLFLFNVSWLTCYLFVINLVHYKVLTFVIRLLPHWSRFVLRNKNHFWKC